MTTSKMCARVRSYLTRACIVLTLTLTLCGIVDADEFHLQAPASSFALMAASGAPTPDAIESCPGCCSSHGGITSSCASNGHVYCSDGSVSPSCLCSSCGVSHNCTGGTIWNGSSCACPSGQTLVGGICTTVTHTCSGGQIWNGSACACPSGQSLVGGICTTTVHTCSGGQIWNGSSCACPSGQSLVGGICTVVTHTCSGGQIWNGSSCSCPSGQSLVGGVCTRDSFSIGAGLTGTWISAGQLGESGFAIEVLEGNQLLIEWYAFGPNGGQAYVGALGPYSRNHATLAAVQITGAGAMFPPGFDSQRTSTTPWGTVMATFSDCDNGEISWDSSVPGFGSGHMAIIRLTQPLGITCDR